MKAKTIYHQKICTTKAAKRNFQTPNRADQNRG